MGSYGTTLPLLPVVGRSVSRSADPGLLDAGGGYPISHGGLTDWIPCARRSGSVRPSRGDAARPAAVLVGEFARAEHPRRYHAGRSSRSARRIARPSWSTARTARMAGVQGTWPTILGGTGSGWGPVRREPGRRLSAGRRPSRSCSLPTRSAPQARLFQFCLVYMHVSGRAARRSAGASSGRGGTWPRACLAVTTRSSAAPTVQIATLLNSTLNLDLGTSDATWTPEFAATRRCSSSGWWYKNVSKITRRADAPCYMASVQ